MSRTADYQLRYQALGLAGSFWARQVTENTKRKARCVATASALASRLQRLDSVSGYTTSSRSVLEDITLTFLDGDFSKSGQDYADFSHTTLGEGSASYVLAGRNVEARDGAVSSAVPSPLADASYAGAGDTSDLRDRFYVKLPAGISPVVIDAQSGTLTAGVDFDVRPGWMSLSVPPGEMFPDGRMHVLTALYESEEYNSHVLGSSQRRTNKWGSDYLKKSQSLKSFRLAAAEAAGMFVLPQDDMLLFSKSLGDGAFLYIFANAGAVVIDYPHRALQNGSTFAAGYVVAGRFDMHALSSYGYGMLNELSQQVLVEDSDAFFELDGCLPVKGLRWSAGQPVTVTRSVGSPTACLQLGGDPADLERLWAVQTAVDRVAGGTTLAEELSLNQGESKDIDFGSLLEAALATRLVAFVYDELPPAMEFRLRQYVSENKPTSCAMVVVKVPAVPYGYQTLLDSFGNEVLQESGDPIFVTQA